MKTSTVHYKSILADGINIFYREAGAANNQVILLLHGYPASSFMFRDLIPILSEKYRVIAPDLPGFGFSEVPRRDKYDYTFANVSGTIQAFIDAIGLKRFAMYILIMAHRWD